MTLNNKPKEQHHSRHETISVGGLVHREIWVLPIINLSIFISSLSVEKEEREDRREKVRCKERVTSYIAV